MSALHVSSGNNEVDPGHQLIELINEVRPHLSHLITRPIQQHVIGTNDEKLMAICEPINRVYTMTTLGLAYVVRPLFVFKAAPRLLGHVGLSLIDSRHFREIVEKLSALRDQEIRLYGHRA
jgi:hypothetical protein